MIVEYLWRILVMGRTFLPLPPSVITPEKAHFELGKY